MAKTEKPSKFTIFETTCRQMKQQGYHQKSLIISARKLNLISILLIVPIIAVPLLLYLLRWGFSQEILLLSSLQAGSCLLLSSPSLYMS